MSTHVSFAHTSALFNDYIYCWFCRPMFIIVLIPKHTVLGAETRAQWVKRLLRKQRNLSSDPLHVRKSWTEQHTPMTPVLGEETAKFWGLSQHSQSGELQVLRKPVFLKKGKKQQRKTLNADLCESTCACALARAHTRFLIKIKFQIKSFFLVKPCLFCISKVNHGTEPIHPKGFQLFFLSQD